MNLLLTSCVDEPEAPKVNLEESGQIQQVKSWFETNKSKLRLPKKGNNLRTDSQELILPFFEKEPDWDKFHHYYFPDGREVFEVSLSNATKYFPASIIENFPNENPEDYMVQNIMFVKHPTENRFDPLIARYYPSDEYSKNHQKNIAYKQIDQYWSGRLDIFTYDEHHFIGFLIEDGEIINTLSYGKQAEANGRISGDCQTVIKEVVWATNEPGSEEDDPYGYVVTYHSILIAQTTCSGSGSYTPTGGTQVINGEPYYSFGATDPGINCGGYCEYIVPVVSRPSSIILNLLTNPCASDIFKQLKKNSLLKSSIGNLNSMNNIIQLLDSANNFEFFIKNVDFTSPQYNPSANAITRARPVFNETTGKYEVTIEINNDYLNSATKLSIARTMLHEMVHAYLVYSFKTGIDGTFNSSLQQYSLNGGNDLDFFHHNWMAKYIDAIGYSLAEWNRRFGNSIINDRNYYDEIAWGGLSARAFQNGQLVWFEAFESKFPDQYKRTEVHQKIENENKGYYDSKGKPC
ncbi:hypothetical protein ACFPIK_14270 [Algoriphagus aquatilis]|uniref:SprT-like family protein n=1 Tax=Algoriphagus aquatilis TaxID=490186 RepID=A0ABW0BY98_9BACT